MFLFIYCTLVDLLSLIPVFNCLQGQVSFPKAMKKTLLPIWKMCSPKVSWILLVQRIVHLLVLTLVQRILHLQLIRLMLVQRILRLLVLTLVQSLPLPPEVQRGVVVAANVKSTGTRPKKRRAFKPRNPNTTASKIRAKAIVNSRKTTRSRQPLLPYSLDNLLSKNRKRVAKLKTLKEEDPILQAFKDNQPEELAELLKDDCDEKNTNKSSLVSSDEVTTEGGKVQVKEYALKRRKKKQKTFHCSSDRCETTECTQKAMNVHEKENHPDISYTCSVCSASNFSSYESVFKHEQRHYKFIHPCDVCGKRFQFPSQVDKHKAVHDPKKGFICTWRGCKKTLANKDSLNQHVLCHQDLKLKCDQCPPDERTFPTTMSLKQHKQGKHGNGFIALCGYVCKWPDERCEHQKECRECRNEKTRNLTRLRIHGNQRKGTKYSKTEVLARNQRKKMKTKMM